MIHGILNIIILWSLVATGFWLLPNGWPWWKNIIALFALCAVALIIVAHLSEITDESN